MTRAIPRLRHRGLRIAAAVTIALASASAATAAAHPARALRSPSTRCPNGTRVRFAVSPCPTIRSDVPTLTLTADQATHVTSDSLIGTVRGAAGALLDPIGTGVGALAGAGLGAIDSWVLTGAGAALNATARAISTTTSPQLQSTWFSSTYWRVAGIGAVLTLPFLFAAAIQALLRSDLSLLVRSAFGYLPLALIGVGLAAPLTMLLLAATDQLCSVMSPAGSNAGAHFLTSAALASAGVSALDGSDFLAFIVGLFTVAAAIALLLELLVREAAVYVVVLMLPLAFAALVWPARRIWAIRMLELLIALIVSKFAVVAVLALGGAAYGNGTDDPGRLLTAMALVILSTFAPWAMLRLIPFTEIAAGASSAIHNELPRATRTATAVGGYAGAALDWLPSVTAAMRTHAQDAGQSGERAALVPAGRSGGSEIADQRGAAGTGADPLHESSRRFDDGAGLGSASGGQGGDGTPVPAGVPVDAPAVVSAQASVTPPHARTMPASETQANSSSGTRPPVNPAAASALAGAAEGSPVAGSPPASAADGPPPLTSSTPATGAPQRGDPNGTNPADGAPRAQLADIGTSLPADYTAVPLWLGLEANRPPWARQPDDASPGTGHEPHDPLPERQPHDGSGLS